MATNLRAYRDGNRLVLVIENPTKDLESVIGMLISGEINPVKDLAKPEPMAKPKLDIGNMQEVKPEKPAAPSAPEKKQELKKAPFVRRLEEQQAAVKASAKPEIIPVSEQVPATAVNIKHVEKADSTPTMTVKYQVADITMSHPVKPSAASNVARPTASRSNTTPITSVAIDERSALIKKVWSMRNTNKIKELLKAKYQDENYDIRRLTTKQLRYLSKL